MQQSAFNYLKQGVMPFFRLPTADFDRQGSCSYKNADVVIAGVPFDGGTTYQPGARLAPFHLRRVSALVQSFHPVFNIDVFNQLNVIDGGNIVFPPFDALRMRDCVESDINRILETRAKPLIVGGDHSITLPCLRTMAKKFGPIAVVHIDAHCDVSGPEVWGERWHHGTFMRQALTEGLIAAGQLYQIATRGPHNHIEEKLFCENYEVQSYPIERFAIDNFEAILDQLCCDIGSYPVYLTFDIDAMDPAFAPGTGTPVPGGLNSREAIQIIRGLHGLNLIGADIVEVSPVHDHADVTCHLAVHLLYEILTLFALNHRENN